jgi:hypothetical protein
VVFETFFRTRGVDIDIERTQQISGAGSNRIEFVRNVGTLWRKWGRRALFGRGFQASYVDQGEYCRSQSIFLIPSGLVICSLLRDLVNISPDSLHFGMPFAELALL